MATTTDKKAAIKGGEFLIRETAGTRNLYSGRVQRRTENDPATVQGFPAKGDLQQAG